MEKALNNIANIRCALRSPSGDDARASSRELDDQLEELKKLSESCQKDSTSVVKEFAEWYLEVLNIMIAYDRVHRNYHLSLCLVVRKAELGLPTTRGRNREMR